MGKCGEMFVKVAKHINLKHDDPVTAGFVMGQAEKVYLGACDAFMIPQSAPISYLFLVHMARIYDLRLHEYAVSGWRREYWFTRRASWVPDAYMFPPLRVHSPKWNRFRALACGVAEADIDEDFHKEERPKNE